MEVFESMDVKQHVQTCTRRGDNFLHLLAADSSLSVADVRVDDADSVSPPIASRLLPWWLVDVQRVIRAVPKSVRSIKVH